MTKRRKTHSETKKNRTILASIFFPIMIMVCSIIGLFGVALYSISLSALKESEITEFQSRAENQKVMVENYLTDAWMMMEESGETVTDKVENIVAEQGKEISQIKKDSGLNRLILESVMPDLIGILRTSNATDFFMVLDGSSMGREEEEACKAGVYLRNSSPNSYSENTGNLLLEMGSEDISKSLQIPLDHYWKSSIMIDESDENCAYYTKPMSQALKGDSSKAYHYGYWTYSYPVDVSDKKMLTYSIPLIASDGTVFGLIGIGMDEKTFASIMETSVAKQGDGSVVFARTEDGVTYEPVIFSGDVAEREALMRDSFLIEKKETGDAYLYLEGETIKKEGTRFASVQELVLYDKNTPFETEQWVVIGVQNQKELLATYNKSQFLLFCMLISGVLFALAGVYWASRSVAQPIRALIEELHKSDPNRPIRLKRVQTEEVDELVLSIETLSNRVAEAYGRISAIIELSDSHLGIFEYKKQEQLIFCNKELYDLLNWEPDIEFNTYADGSGFIDRIKALYPFDQQKEERTFRIQLEDGTYRWLRMNHTEDEKAILGVLTDITESILEKKRIEYERDFDVLTRLRNRRAFEHMTARYFEEKHENERVAVIVWDLDNLKYINDYYGHSVGDQYIVTFANCLRKVECDNIRSCRRSGDEFVTMLMDPESGSEIEARIHALWEDIQKTEMELPDGGTYRVRVSAGVAWHPEDAGKYQELFQYADFAMYEAKHSRKGTLVTFKMSQYRKNGMLLQGHGEFNALLEKRSISFKLQPIITVEDGQIYGYEMLMRGDGDLFSSPADILRMAREQSKLYELEVLTWFEAMKTYVHMKESSLLPQGSKVFINSIANQLLSREMSEIFLETFGEECRNVVCEFTEEERSNSYIIQKKKSFVKKAGGLVALDDYGCGYNGESVLLDLSPDIVKLDIQLIHNIHLDEDRQSLVGNLIHYAHKRNIKVLGEGVGCREEVMELIDLGVDMLQGFYIAKPSSDGEIPDWSVIEELLQYQKECKKEQEQES